MVPKRSNLPDASVEPAATAFTSERKLMVLVGTTSLVAVHRDRTFVQF
jgi:hypothetical protein